MRTTSNVAGAGFIADPASVVRNSGRQVDWARVPEDYRQAVGSTVTTSGAAAAAATSIPVVALSAALPVGQVLNFTGAGEFAILTAAAAVGATALTVEALDAGIESGDTATVAGTGKKRIPAGTVVSEFVTVSGAKSTRLIAPTAAAGGTAIGVIATDANEDAGSESLSGYGVITGAKVHEPLLPEATGTPRALPTALRNALIALDGGGFSFEPYTDSSAA